MSWLLLAIIAIVLILVIWQWKNVKDLVKLFDRGNTITFGPKGSGKDLLWQKVINARKKPYYAVMPYGGQYTHLEVGQVQLDPNTYEQFISGKVKIVKKTLKENMDFYISDAGITLPSQYDGLLNKQYPSFPIAYALSRQLWNMNIHMNSQAIDRPWIKLREQADGFIKALGTVDLIFGLVVRYRTFEKKKSADADMSPMSTGLINLNKFSKAEKQVFEATNGVIKEGWVFIRKSKIYYDTRYYHYVVFGEKAPKKSKKLFKKRATPPNTKQDEPSKSTIHS